MDEVAVTVEEVDSQDQGTGLKVFLSIFITWIIKD
jgi:hypothetical protein